MAIKVKDKATGQDLQVTSAEAQDGLLKGKFIPGTATFRVSKGNKTGIVGEDQLRTALAQGARIVDDEEARQVKIRREESDVASQALGVVESAASGATFGATRLAADLLGADPERARARQEATGALGTLAEVGGGLAATLVTGGAGLAGTAGRAGSVAGKAGRVLSAPARAVERLGARTEAALGGGFRGTVGRSAVEGAFAGGGAALDESVLRDDDLGDMAEHVAIGSVLGGVLGGGVGTAAHGASSLIGGTQRAAGRGLVRAGKAVESTGDLVGGAIAKGSEVGAEAAQGVLAKIRGIDPSMSDELAGEAAKHWTSLAKGNGVDHDVADRLGAKLAKRDTRERLSRNIENPKEVERELAEEVAPVFSDLRQGVATGRKLMSDDMTVRNVSRLLPESEDAIRKAASAAADQMEHMTATVESAIAAHQAEAELYKGARLHDVSALAEAGTVLREMRDRIAATPPGTMRDATAATYGAMAEAKRRLRTITSRLRKAESRSGDNAAIRTLGILDDDVYNGLRDHLADEKIWHEAGAAQADMNRRAAAAIEAEDLVGPDSASNRLLRGKGPVDNQDVLTVMRQSGKWSGATKTENLSQVLSLRREWLESVKKHGDLTPEQIADVEAAIAADAKFTQMVESQQDRIREMEDVANVRGVEGGGSPSINALSTIGPTAASMAGAALGGPVGALAGFLVGQGTRPYTLMRRFASLQGTHSKVGGLLAAAVDGLGVAVEHGGKAGQRVGRSVQSGSRRAGKALRSRGERLAEAKGPRIRAGIVGGMAADPDMIAMAQNPERISEQVTEVVGDDAPIFAQRVQDVAQRAVAYLKTIAPEVYSSTTSGGPQLVDPIRSEGYAIALRAIRKPAEALADIKRGMMSTETVRALDAVYPGVMAKARERVLAQVLEAAVSGKPVPYQRRVSAAVLLGIPTDDTMRPGTLQAIQASFAGDAAESASRHANPKIRASAKPTNTKRYQSALAGTRES